MCLLYSWLGDHISQFVQRSVCICLCLLSLVELPINLRNILNPERESVPSWLSQEKLWPLGRGHSQSQAMLPLKKATDGNTHADTILLSNLLSGLTVGQRDSKSSDCSIQSERKLAILEGQTEGVKCSMCREVLWRKLLDCSCDPVLQSVILEP